MAFPHDATRRKAKKRKHIGRLKILSKELHEEYIPYIVENSGMKGETVGAVQAMMIPTKGRGKKIKRKLVWVLKGNGKYNFRCFEHEEHAMAYRIFVI